jgi:hypothetical protein
MDGLSQAMVARMPLAESVLLLWRWVASEDRLAGIWSQHRGRCYEKVIFFSLIVHLIADCLLKHGGSGRRAFQKNIEAGELEASIQAAYGKLRRLPIPLSEAFLLVGSQSLREAFPVWAEWQLPQSLRLFTVIILDGKAIKRVAKRLKPLWGIPGGLLGGRALVAIDWCTGMVVAMRGHADGDANDVGFVGDLVPVVYGQVAGPRLWMGDRAFCDLTQPGHFTGKEGDHFLVRHHPKVKFHRDKNVPERRGQDEKGRTYTEQSGWIGSASDKRRRYVRSVELQIPGEKPLVLITDLLDADLYPAGDLLWLYSERWTIERVFQKVTEVFGLSRLIGGTPEGCLFQFAFCLLLYNMIQVMRGYIAQAQNLEPEDISLENLFRDVEEQLIAWNVMLDLETTMECIQDIPDADAIRQLLHSRLSTVWSDTWRKSPPQQRREKIPAKRNRGHSSVYRILEDYRRRKAKPKARNP